MVTNFLKKERMVIIMKEKRNLSMCVLVSAARIEQAMVKGGTWTVGDVDKLYIPAELTLTDDEMQHIISEICVYLDMTGAQVREIDGKKSYYLPPRGASVNPNGEAF